MTEYQERQATKRAECLALAQGIAKALPGKWTAKSNGDLDHSAEVTDDKGHRFYVNTEHAGPARVSISGRYPTRPNKNSEGWEEWALRVLKSETGREWERPSITCARTKTPEQIAKDIARRFLPDYFAIVSKVRLAIVQADQNDASRAADVQAIIAASGGRAEKRGENGFHFYPSGVEKVGYYDGQSSGGGVQIEFRSIPVAIAAEMLALYHAHVAKVNGWTEVET